MPSVITTDQLRERFLAFFEANGHQRVASDGLVPSDDPTVLFTSAGMNQFKPYFLGKKTLDQRYRGAVSCQKCLRTGDLDSVGRTPSHHSFFEMLGNFSFGAYFKREAIGWAWEFLTGYLTFNGPEPSRTPKLCLGLPRERLWVSIHQDDVEAHELWRALGMPEERIRRFGDADNFWPANARTAGPNGPCGPCSEIYYDAEGRVEGPTSVEIWNLVFTQYDRRPDGTLAPLPRKNIDTGMGLERLARVIQGKTSNFEIDVLAPIVQAADRVMKPRAGQGRDGDELQRQQQMVLRAVADHARAIAFLIAEGILPSKEERGYVLRMLIRRCMRYAYSNVYYEQPFVHRLAPDVIHAMRGGYPELSEQRSRIQEVVRQEEEQFAVALRGGSIKAREFIEAARRRTPPILTGEEAFKLWDTFGYPLEVTIDTAQEQGCGVDRDGFNVLMDEQRRRSRGASKMQGTVFVETFASIVEQLNRRTEFLGYTALEGAGRVEAILADGRLIERAERGQEVWLIADRTPCYGESGGQQGDTGAGESDRGRLTILDTQRVGQTIIHRVRVEEGIIGAGDRLTLRVDPARRLRLARHHTATHLLHSALRRVLGEQVQQAGSLVAPDRLRLDVLHGADVSDRALQETEALVNEWIRRNEQVTAQEMSLAEARRLGALAFFGEKYGDRVRVVSIGDVSKELCGGTHAGQTGQIGFVRIVSEGSVAAGTRRIEALAGDAAYQRAVTQEAVLTRIAQSLRIPVERLEQAVAELSARCRQQEKELERLQLQQVTAGAISSAPTTPVKQIGPLRVIVQRVNSGGVDVLRRAADVLRKQTGADVVVLGAGVEDDRSVCLVATASVAAVQAGVRAADLIRQISPLVGGSGGGRPDFAQGGGTDVEKLTEALAASAALIEQWLGVGHRG